MPRTKKIKLIEDKLNENSIKVNDIDTKNEEMKNIKEMELEIYNKVYKVSELIKLYEKESKSNVEQEIVNRFIELMFNYYRGIEYAILKDCYGNMRTIENLKSKLDYESIERKCSRGNMKFDKVTVDTVIDFIEKYNK